MAIRFDNELNSEIERTVRNFNAKVKYNKFKTRGKGMLPQTISVKEIKAKYSDKTRRELLKQLKLYQSFGNRDALDKIKDNRLSAWESKYFKANLKKTKEFYDNEIADLERIIGDRPEYHLKQHQRLQTLIKQREELDKNFSTLNEDQIKGMRGYFNYAERSEIVKRQGFRLYLSQLERTMRNLGYTKAEIDNLINKFAILSENEFTEMVRQEDIIDDVYNLVDSPKGRGEYELIADETRARAAIEKVLSQADTLINQYKSSD